MIRQRFSNGRLLRIGAWTLAGITWAVAFLTGQDAATADPDATPPADTETSSVGTVSAAVPAALDSGLLVLRYQAAPVAPPPAITRVVVVEGAPAPESAEPPSGVAPSSAPSQSTTATPAPPPAPLPAAPAPIQSAGS